MRIEDFIWTITRHNDKALNIARKFAPGYNFKISKNEKFLAYMNHDAKEIVLSITKIAMIVAETMATYKSTGKLPKVVKKAMKEQKISESNDEIVEWLAFYLCLGVYFHEIAHVMYTPTHSVVSKAMKDLNVSVPEKFVFFIANLVEDAYIQRRFLHDFTFKNAQYAMRLAEEVIQGPKAIKDLQNQKQADIKQVLFFLVLTRYNRGIKTPLPQAIVSKFLSIYYVENTRMRVELTIKFAQELFDFLKQFQQDKHKEEQKKQKQQQKQDSDGDDKDQASLGETEMTPPNEGDDMEQDQEESEGKSAPEVSDNDNLMDNKEEDSDNEDTEESQETEESDNEYDEDESSEESDQDGSEGQEEDSSDSDGEDDGSDESSEEVDGSDGEDDDTEGHEDEQHDSDEDSEHNADGSSDSDGDDTSDEEESGDEDDGSSDDGDEDTDGTDSSGDSGESEEDSGVDGESDQHDSEDSEDASESASESDDSSDESADGGGAGDNEDDDDIEELSDEELEEIIDEVIDELMEEEDITHEGDDKGDVIQDNNVAKAEAMTEVRVHLFEPDRSYKQSLTNRGEMLLKSFQTSFKRIQSYTFNSKNYNRKRGFFDQKVAHKTSLTNRVFYKKEEPKRDMDLYCLLTLDGSASMNSAMAYNLSFFDYFKIVSSTLLYSLEQVRAKTEMLGFSNKTVKVKDMNQRIEPRRLVGHLSSIHRIYLGSGTSILDSMQYADNIFKTKNFKDKLFLIFTDGEYKEEDGIVQAYAESLHKQGVHIVIVGIELSAYVLESFKSVFNKAYVRNYVGMSDLEQKLPKDLTKYLTHKFMKNKIY